jgi:hypothetical protein
VGRFEGVNVRPVALEALHLLGSATGHVDRLIMLPNQTYTEGSDGRSPLQPGPRPEPERHLEAAKGRLAGRLLAAFRAPFKWQV